MKVEDVAKKYGWKKIKSQDPTMISFLKTYVENRARINVWEGRKGRTVGTYLTHPKQGKTQLFRRKVTDSELVKIFENPRIHTGKGYR